VQMLLKLCMVLLRRWMGWSSGGLRHLANGWVIEEVLKCIMMINDEEPIRNDRVLLGFNRGSNSYLHDYFGTGCSATIDQLM